MRQRKMRRHVLGAAQHQSLDTKWFSAGRGNLHAEVSLFFGPRVRCVPLIDDSEYPKSLIFHLVPLMIPNLCHKATTQMKKTSLTPYT